MRGRRVAEIHLTRVVVVQADVVVEGLFIYHRLGGETDEAHFVFVLRRAGRVRRGG